MDIQSIHRRLAALKIKRQQFDPLLQEVAEYVMPDRGGFGSPLTAGAKRRQKIFDSTAPQANDLFAAFLHGMLTNPATKWFDMRACYNELNDFAAVKNWIQVVVDRLYNAIHIGQSGFISALHEVYIDLGAFGTGCLFIGDRPGVGLFFKSIPLAQIHIAEGMDGRINTVIRSFSMTAQQIVDTWGLEAASRAVQKAYEKEPDREFNIIHAVWPRDNYDVNKQTTQHLPFLSCYLEQDNNHILFEGGYRELPYMVPRLSKGPGEIYGRSPAMTALADIKMINAMAKANIRGTQKMIDPPILVPNDGFITRGGLGPGDIAYYDSSIDGPDKIKPLVSGARPDVALEVMSDVRQRIRSSYYIDQLMLTEGLTMSATEVLHRRDEKMRLMGPMLGRLQTELLEPMITRIFNIMTRAGQFPDVPLELKVLPANTQSLKIEYVSPIARAQRMDETAALIATIEQTAKLAQFDPLIMNNLNADKTFRGIAERHGVPVSWLRDQQEVGILRQSAQQQVADEALKDDLERAANGLAKLESAVGNK